MAIPQHFLDELIERTDIVDVVGRYVTLKKGGANLLGLCPFHEEKSPSFTVSPSKQFYHCFGCGKHGNAIGFLMDYAGLGFVDAVKDLAQRAGLPMPRQERESPTQAAERQQRRQQQKTLAELNAQAAAAYKQHLKQASEAILYLKGRGVSGAIAARFQLGYAPPGEHALAAVFPDYADPQLEDAGLVIYKPESGRRYDRFRDRLMFPIRNVRGETIGFGGRIMGSGQPKYLNSPQTPIFHKGRELYGLFEARQAIRSQGYALVCEGYMDVVALAQWGFANAVATLGTACTEHHVQLLLRHTDQLVFAFDGDSAGRKAAAKALECALPFADERRSMRFLFLPKEHDPDSFIRERGEQAFAEQVELAIPLSQYLLQVASQDCQLATAEGRARMAHRALPLWAMLPEGALKLQIRDEVARIAQLAREDLQQLWQQQAAALRPLPTQRSPHPQSDAASARARGSAYAPAAMPPLHEPPMQAWPDEFDGPPQGLPYEPLDGMHDGSAPQYPPAAAWPGEPAPHAWPARPAWPRRAASHGDGGLGALNAPVRTPQRLRPLRREEHAACVLLAHMPLLESLSQQDLGLLCRLPAPDGQLFAWLDDHYQQHGAQSWAELQPALQQAPPAALARLLPHIQRISEHPLEDYRDEIASALKHIMIRQLQIEIDAVTRTYEHDSQAGAKLRQLTSHLAALK
ncbi:DNA primase [Vandammella animalimorsus]|uniref:DNA primase n=1 Tax=Vandammella animalimorsus TaxID=2029117 RepID=A0A2A2AU28_9BURK|nr:DNA primase [Vandammella animalimorsus]PAT41263.1 DNA primase [Vandammella animalimorsus]